jgi:HD superfamily phosphodiesterase
MKTFVIELLKNSLPVFYYYHNYEHTLYVEEKAIEIAKKENCTEQEIELVSTGALWHDTGFINSYHEHEEESLLFAKQYLPGYGYSAEDIDRICGMIIATKIPQSPKNKLEEIVADADLEYLGTDEAGAKAELLFKEWKHLDPALTREEWNRRQISFLRSHHYFTRFCKGKIESMRLAYLQKLITSSEHSQKKH